LAEVKRVSRRVVSADEFHDLTRSIVGLPISHAWRGYGSAVFLELGRLRRRPVLRQVSGLSRRRSPPNPKGESGVMIEWSWRIERAQSIAVGSGSSERRLNAAIPRLIGPKVSEISVVGRLPELIMALSNGRWVHSFMTADGQPAWTVFLPDGSWLTVEGGRLSMNAGASTEYV
jgi:hypothetical protein